ncbi:MAG: OmpH family outer membrane protein [Nitrospinae bacterium]|nr:OmpH family outer membrane protein [Nitrospinota bacterium]
MIAALSVAISLPAYAAEVKIGVINMHRALNDTDEGKRASEKLNAKLNAEGKNLKVKFDEVKKMEDDLNQQGYMLSEAARAEKQEKLKRAARDFEKLRDDKQKEFIAESKESTERILRKLMDIVRDYAKAEGYVAIFDSSAPAQALTGGVVWADPKADITGKVIDLYNASGAKAPDKQ